MLKYQINLMEGSTPRIFWAFTSPGSGDSIDSHFIYRDFVLQALSLTRIGSFRVDVRRKSGASDDTWSGTANPSMVRSTTWSTLSMWYLRFSPQRDSRRNLRLSSSVMAFIMLPLNRRRIVFAHSENTPHHLEELRYSKCSMKVLSVWEGLATDARLAKTIDKLWGQIYLLRTWTPRLFKV